MSVYRQHLVSITATAAASTTTHSFCSLFVSFPSSSRFWLECYSHFVGFELEECFFEFVGKKQGEWHFHFHFHFRFRFHFHLGCLFREVVIAIFYFSWPSFFCSWASIPLVQTMVSVCFCVFNFCNFAAAAGAVAVVIPSSIWFFFFQKRTHGMILTNILFSFANVLAFFYIFFPFFNYSFWPVTMHWLYRHLLSFL